MDANYELDLAWRWLTLDSGWPWKVLVSNLIISNEANISECHQAIYNVMGEGSTVAMPVVE